MTNVNKDRYPWEIASVNDSPEEDSHGTEQGACTGLWGTGLTQSWAEQEWKPTEI